MRSEASETRSSILAATLTAGVLIAFQVGARATRDALFLSSFGVASLPAMMMGTSLLAIGFAFLGARALTAWGPSRVLPAALAASAALLLGEWAVSLWFPRAAAVIVYLHYGCLGALLISGFWSVVNERFDPRTAKRRLGPISAWGTLGGLLGGLIAAQVGRSLPVTAMLPILAGFHLVAAAAVSQIQIGAPLRPAAAGRVAGQDDPRSGLQALKRSTYLRGLVALVVLATTGEGFLDLAFKSRAASAFGQGGDLLRFFAVFYTLISLATLLVQALASRAVLERVGPARTVAALPAGVAAAAAGALLAPGLPTAAFARGAESVLSNSLYRTGYEVLFTPVSPREKRPAKALADVGASRVGDLLAAGIAQGVLGLSFAHAPAILTALALAVSMVAIFAATRLHQGYVRSLERGLQSRAVALDLSDVRDGTTRSVLLRTLDPLALSQGLVLPRQGPPSTLRTTQSIHSLDIDHLISCLAKDDEARRAIEALEKTGPEVIGRLVARLLDPREHLTVRRRIPLVLASYCDPGAVEGLALGLGDRRFEVRYRCGRGLSHLLDLDPALRIAPGRAYEAVLREVEAGVGVWEGKRLLDALDDESWSPVMDEVIRERANRSLEHVFTLLALVLPRQPLRIAFRGLYAKDAVLRGTALEYLESSLPPEIRKPLWPYLEDQRPRRALSGRPADEVLNRLLESNDSIVLHLKELQQKGEA